METDLPVGAGTASTGDTRNVIQGASSNQVVDRVGSTIGGEANQADGRYETVPGGRNNR